MQTHIGTTKRGKDYVEQKRSEGAIIKSQTIKESTKRKKAEQQIGQTKFEYIMEHFQDLNEEKRVREEAIIKKEQQELEDFYSNLDESSLSEDNVNDEFLKSTPYSYEVEFLKGVDPNDIFEQRDPEDVKYEMENNKRRDFLKIKDEYVLKYKKDSKCFKDAVEYVDACKKIHIILTYLHATSSASNKKTIYLLNMYDAELKEFAYAAYNLKLKPMQYRVDRKMKDVNRVIEGFISASYTIKDAMQRCGLIEPERERENG